MSKENSVAPDLDTEMTDVQPEVDQEQLLHEKRLKLLETLDISPDYNFKYLTNEFVENFDSQFDSLVKNVTEAPEDVDDFFYEIVYSAKYYEDRLPIDKLKTILNCVADVIADNAFYFKFMSVYNTFKADDKLKKLLDGFRKLTSLHIGKYLADEKLFMKMDQIKSYQRVKSEYLLSNFVEQKKYNLLFESNEGFAKMIALLHEALDSDDSCYQVDYTVKAIEKLIGHFSLDPIRVLDLLLDLFINSILKNYRFCVDILKKSQWWPKNNESDNSCLKNLNKGGNKQAAALLGQKLNYFASTKKDFPETLKALIGILIKEGFICFGDIYKYTSPDEETMKQLQEKLAKEIDDEIFKASASALALSGPLADDDEDGSNSKTKSISSNAADNLSPADSVIINQKLQVFKALLAVGLYWPSIYMLTRYPYLVYADKDISPMILRLFHKMIEPLKCQVIKLSSEDIKELTVEKQTAFSRGRETVEFEEFAYNSFEVFRPLHTGHTNRKFVYFYHEWDQGLPTAKSYEDLFELSAELLPFVGAKLGEDLQLMTLLSRFGVDDLTKSKKDATYEHKLNNWFEYFRKYIFPASTVIVENSITTHDIYDLLKEFPLQWRYNLYGELVNVISKQNDVVRLHYSKAEKQTKNVLKRITTENVRPMMRRFAKISFANPLPSFSVIVTQVESYDNLSNLMVDAARYFTDYAWDVLPYVLLMRLTARRNSVQSDGMNEAPWLQSLATFIAKLGKSYASMNLTPILTYIIKGLHENNTIGLTILREVVNQMGGIQQSSNLSANQIKLLNSGESLQRSINKVIFDTRELCTKPALRLLRQLIASDQLSELFILLCDFHKNLIDKSNENAHYKVLSSQSDEITSVLHTFIELINYFLRDDPENFKKSIIGLSDLVKTYGVETAWAFELWRRNVGFEDIVEIDIADVDFKDLSKDLYLSFWKFSLYDINYDGSAYTHEKERLSEANNSLADQIKRSRISYGEDPKEKQAKDAKMRKEIAFNESIINQIPIDDEKHKLHFNETIKAIQERRENWFKEVEPSASEVESFFQYCIVPRAIHSETDAIFTGKFITSLFNIDTSKKLVDIFLKSEILDTLIYTITPLEAENMGFFLAELFKFYEELRTKEGLSNDVKKLIYSWHAKSLVSIKLNIESENYMSRRNAFTLLKNLIDCYPIVEDHAEEIIELIERVSNSETRNDLKLASDAILAHIKSRSKKWIHLWEFYELPEEQKQEAVNKRETLLKERENRKLEARKAEISRQKAERDAEFSSRAQSRAHSRAESRSEYVPGSRPDSRADTNQEAGSDIRFRPRKQEIKDEDGDVSMTEVSDKKEDEEEIGEHTEAEAKLEVGKTDQEKDGGEDHVTDDNDSDRIGEAESKGETSANGSENSSKEEDEAKGENIPSQEFNGESPDIKNTVREVPSTTDRPNEVAKSSSKVGDTYIPSPRTDKPEPRRYQDVTASVISSGTVTPPPAPLKPSQASERLKQVVEYVSLNKMGQLREYLNDDHTDEELVKASMTPSTFKQNLPKILKGYARKIAGPKSPAVAYFDLNIEEAYQNVTPPKSPYVRKSTTPQPLNDSRTQKRSLPSQEELVNFSSRQNQGSRNFDNSSNYSNRGIKPLPSGPSSQASKRFNQGNFRSSSGSDTSYTPPAANRSHSSHQNSTRKRIARPHSRQHPGVQVPPPPPPPGPPPQENPNKRHQGSSAHSNYNQSYRNPRSYR